MKEARTELLRRIDDANVRVCRAQREFLALVREVDRTQAWSGDGARDMSQWLWLRYGVSDWKARKWIASAHALEFLPEISAAMCSGELGIDKVVELTRFATPETEGALIGWAFRVAPGRIRERADTELRREVEQARDADRCRRLDYWYFDEGTRYALHAEGPAADGAVVARALERLADDIPVMPGEHGEHDRPARLADALVALASVAIGADADPDRATVVVHANVEALASDASGCEVEGGGVAHPETVRRLACTSRVQAVVEDAAGNVVALGRVRREPPAWMSRQLRYRDRGGVFPGCGTRAFTDAHHIEWWSRGGRTTLENLALICSWHHKLVHEYGWRIERGTDGVVRWFRPNGVRYRAGPGPPVTLAS